MRWIEVPNTLKRAVPAWQRSACLLDDGSVFLPAAIMGSEEMAVLSASWDGERVIVYKNHTFVSSAWLAREYPKAKDLCEKIERRVLELVGSPS